MLETNKSQAGRRGAKQMSRNTIHRLLVAASVVAAAASLFACSGGGSGNGSEGRQTPALSPLPALALVDWAERVCALSVEAAGTLDPPAVGDPETPTLAERKQRAAEVLAPRAEALAGTAQELAGLQPPEPAAGFHETLQTTMAGIAAAWQDLVDAAEQAQSGEKIDAANGVWTQAQNEADAAVIAAYDRLDDETTAALSQPEDCGILNQIRS